MFPHLFGHNKTSNSLQLLFLHFHITKLYQLYPWTISWIYSPLFLPHHFLSLGSSFLTWIITTASPYFLVFPFSKLLLTVLACARANSVQLCLTLCDSMDCSPPESSIHGTLQARIPKWVSLFQGIVLTQGSKSSLLVSCIGRRLLDHQHHLESLLSAPEVKVKVAQSCPTLCDPMDYTVHGIL